MADAYLKVKDNGAQGLALEREETDVSVNELKKSLKLPSNLAQNASWTQGIITASTGVYANPGTNLIASDYVDISGIGILKYYRVKTTGSSTPTNGIAFYSSNSEESYISGIRSDYGAETLGSGYLYTAAVPENAQYARFTWWKSDVAQQDFAVYDNTDYSNSIPEIAWNTAALIGGGSYDGLISNNYNKLISSGGQISGGSPRKTAEIQNDGYKYISLIGGELNTYICFLTETIDGLSSGDAVSFCTGESRRTVSANETYVIPIPETCQYIEIMLHGATADTTPKSCYLFKDEVPIPVPAEEGENRFYAIDDVAWRPHMLLNARNVTEQNDGYAYTDYLPIEGGNIVKYTGALDDGDDHSFVCYLHEYSLDAESVSPTFGKRTQILTADGDVSSVRLAESTKFVRFIYGYSETGTELTAATRDACFAAETTRTPAELNRPSLNILFIGNSKAYDSVSYVPAVLKSLGVDANINIGIIYHGGQGLQEHYKAFVAGVENWAILTESVNLTKWRNVLGGSGHNYVVSGLDCFKYRKWDIISFQQSTTRAGDYSEYQPWLNGIIEYINDNVDYKWKMAWNSVDSTSVENNPSDPSQEVEKLPPDYQATLTNYNDLITALQSALAENPLEIVFPVATATQNARRTALGQLTTGLPDNSYTPGLLLNDAKHAQEGIGCLVEAYTIAIKLMELLGIHDKSILNDNTVVDSAFLSAWSIQGQHGSPVGSTDDAAGKANRRIAQKCAILACQRPMELSNIVTALPANYPGAYPDDGSEETPENNEGYFG